jgi:hypothetical protein
MQTEREHRAATFGNLTSTSVGARVMRFSGKLSF